jgi:protein gp37
MASHIGHARVDRRAQGPIWAVMGLAAGHQFQVLTKRPKRLARALADPRFVREVSEQATELSGNRSWQRPKLDLGRRRPAV